MMTVLECITAEHNLLLVALAALFAFSGAWITIRLYSRASMALGGQKAGWLFLTATAGGSSIWCTHFVAMLAYQPKAPVSFDPLLTILSLIVAVVGTFSGFWIGLSTDRKIVRIIGGALVGIAVSVMHYTGMMAYRISGIVTWNTSYIIASVVLAALLCSLALYYVSEARWKAPRLIASAILAAGIVSLHFTGMAALQVIPMLPDTAAIDMHSYQALAFAIAAVGMIVAGAGLTSNLIDDRARADNYARLRHMAMNDQLTDLPNRAAFTDHLDSEIAIARETGGSFALINIDLDRFKEINDIRGHAAGDDVLRTVSRRMQNLLREGQFVARLGGDEFVAIHRSGNRDEVIAFLNRLESAICRPIRLDDGDVSVGGSFGVAFYPEDANESNMLVNCADMAMYRAKADRTRTICFYEQAMDESVRARRALAVDLREAIIHSELSLVYQVQTAVATGEITGYEALLRWNHPKFGLIPPGEFIPLAEETGLILQIGEWVLERACIDAATWNENYKVAVNVSPIQIAQGDLAQHVQETLLKTGLPPHRLELELTESAVINDKVRTLHILRQIRSMGVSIALDDFGTGYSSLDTLRAFPFDKIKLDQSFMVEFETSEQAVSIVRSVLALGRSLNIPVLAEGIETACQLDLLGQEGCDIVQGYYLGRPASLTALIETGKVTTMERRAVA